jgi:hypothetical protein
MKNHGLDILPESDRIYMKMSSKLGKAAVYTKFKRYILTRNSGKN